jgi:hypothetical protein
MLRHQIDILCLKYVTFFFVKQVMHLRSLTTASRVGLERTHVMRGSTTIFLEPSLLLDVVWIIIVSRNCHGDNDVTKIFLLLSHLYS